MSYYLHDVPGRLRVKSPLVKNNQKVADEIKKLLALVHGINSVEINLITGSVLINYHPDKRDRKEILNLLTERGYFDRSKATTNDEYFKNAAASSINFVSRSVLSDIIFAII